MDLPSFHLEGIVADKSDMKDFDGPLSLILLLLQKSKIEIRDIKISDILDQYLDYLDKMQRMDLEIASEFVRMASYLIYIKTKMLLTSDDEEVSELELLIESLEQLKAKDTLEQIEQIVPSVADAYKTGALYFVKRPEILPKNACEYEYRHSGLELLESLYNVLNVSKDKVVDTGTFQRSLPQKVVYSVRNKSRHILTKLRLRDVPLSELYIECRSKSEVVATFVSVLELCSMGSIIISHTRDGSDYELSFAGGSMEDILEMIEE